MDSRLLGSYTGLAPYKCLVLMGYRKVRKSFNVSHRIGRREYFFDDWDSQKGYQSCNNISLNKFSDCYFVLLPRFNYQYNRFITWALYGDSLQRDWGFDSNTDPSLIRGGCLIDISLFGIIRLLGSYLFWMTVWTDHRWAKLVSTSYSSLTLVHWHCQCSIY